jgi:RHS repeat-associated protein
MRYSYSYHADGRLKEKTASGRRLLAYEYDLNGNKIRQTDVTGKTTEYRFNSLDLLTDLYENGSRIAGYDYNPDGTIQALQNGAALRTSYAYDGDKNILGLEVTLNGEALVQNRYDYDGNGNRTQKATLGGDTRFTYDTLNQLVKVEYPALTEELFYDRAGNRTRRLANGVEEQYTYDARNRLTEYTRGGQTAHFNYDNAGNLLKDDKSRYEYDGFNRTVKAETFDGHVQVNRYDAEGLRYEMEENGKLVQFIFSGREVAVEINEAGINRLIRSHELIMSDAEYARTYYHYAADEIGSITHTADADGQVLNRYQYDAWGNITEQEETVPNRFKYTGQQLDPITQQYYLRARFYNPVIARFTQEDTYRGDGLNLYAYCQNNPVVYYDPSGYAASPICDAKANAYQKILDEGGQLTKDQYAELKRYNRAKDNSLYQAEREKGISPSEAYKNQLKTEVTGKGNTGISEGDEILFGQRRIADTFRKGSGAPDYIDGRKLADVAADLKSGNLHPDQLEVKYFTHPTTGQKIAESNRTLATLSMADMKPTKVREIIPSQEVLNRLTESPLRQRGEVFDLPGRAIPITPGQNNLKILDVIRLP